MCHPESCATSPEMASRFDMSQSFTVMPCRDVLPHLHVLLMFTGTHTESVDSYEIVTFTPAEGEHCAILSLPSLAQPLWPVLLSFPLYWQLFTFITQIPHATESTVYTRRKTCILVSIFFPIQYYEIILIYNIHTNNNFLSFIAVQI